MKKNIILTFFIILVPLLLLAFYTFFKDIKKCPLGQTLYFKGTSSESCWPIGTKVDPHPPMLNNGSIRVYSGKDNSLVGRIWVVGSAVQYSAEEKDLQQYFKQNADKWANDTFTIEYEPTLGKIMAQKVKIQDTNYLAGLWVYLDDEVAKQVFNNKYVFHLEDFKLKE